MITPTMFFISLIITTYILLVFIPIAILDKFEFEYLLPFVSLFDAVNMKNNLNVEISFLNSSIYRLNRLRETQYTQNLIESIEVGDKVYTNDWIGWVEEAKNKCYTIDRIPTGTNKLIFKSPTAEIYNVTINPENMKNLVFVRKGNPLKFKL